MPIVTADIEYRLSGGAANTSPAAALGGARSTAAGGLITSGVDNNLFDDVTGDESAAGDIEYRCFYVRNAHGSITWQAVKIWLDSLTSSSSTELDIGLDPAGVNGTATTIANESAAPAGVAFSRPTTKGAGLAVGDIPAGQHIAVWVRRTVDSGATAAADSGSVRAEGDTVA